MNGNARNPTIKVRRDSGSLPRWWAHISIPHPADDLLAYESCVCAFTRDRVVAKAERHILRHYADAELRERIEVSP